MSNPESAPAGYVSRDPWPIRELGGHAIASRTPRASFQLSEEDAAFMAYAGYPDVQADFMTSDDKANQSETLLSINTQNIQQPETITEIVARTRYVVTSTPVNSNTQPASKD